MEDKIIKCEECEFRFKCNIRKIKEIRKSQLEETGDEPIDREKVKQLFEGLVESRIGYGNPGGNSHGWIAPRDRGKK